MLLFGSWDDKEGNRPANARTMSERLKRVAPALLDVYGLKVDQGRGNHRRIALQRSKRNGGRVVRRRKRSEQRVGRVTRFS